MKLPGARLLNVCIGNMAGYWVLWGAAGVLVPLIAGVILGWFGGFLPDHERAWCHMKELFRQAAPGDQFTVFLARLGRDTRGEQTDHVDTALGELKDVIDVYRTCRVLKLEDAATQEVAENRLKEKANRWLKRSNADLLIWGQVFKDESDRRLIRLRFVHGNWSRAASGGGMAGDRSAGLEDFKIQGSGLDDIFAEELKAQLHAVVLSQISPITEEQGRRLVQILKPVVNKIRSLRKSKGDHFDRNQNGSFAFALGAALAVIGKQSNDSASAGEAVVAFEEALKVWTRNDTPRDWVMIQSNLGTALMIQGGLEGNMDRVKEAVQAFDVTLEVDTHESQGWAITQHNRGLALGILGVMEQSEKRLKEAIHSFRESLRGLARQQTPLLWSMVQSSLGVALSDLGELEESTERLEEARETFAAALKARESIPLAWATTQHNLGTTLLRLGELEESTERLEEAVKVFNSVLKIRRRDVLPQAWATTQRSRGIAFSNLGFLEKDEIRLRQAIIIFDDVLRVATQSRVPQAWARTQHSLGIALLRLGKLEGNKNRSEKAVEAFRKAVEAFDAALEVHKRELLPQVWAATQRHRGTAFMILGIVLLSLEELEKSKETLEKAVEAIGGALEVRMSEALLRDWAMAQQFLGSALLLLAEMEQSKGHAEQAVRIFEEILKVEPPEVVPASDRDFVESSLEEAHSFLAKLEAQQQP